MVRRSVRPSVRSHLTRAHSTGYNSLQILLIFILWVNVIMKMIPIDFRDDRIIIHQNIVSDLTFNSISYIVQLVLTLQTTIKLLTDFFYFCYVGLWHHKEEPYRFWCRSDNFSPIYSLKLSIFMTKRLVNILCSLYRLQLLIDLSHLDFCD